MYVSQAEKTPPVSWTMYVSQAEKTPPVSWTMYVSQARPGQATKTRRVSKQKPWQWQSNPKRCWNVRIPNYPREETMTIIEGKLAI